MTTALNQAKWDRRFLKIAREVATWSKDPSTQVGAILADERHRLVSLGFNGLAHGLADVPERLADRDLKTRIILHAEQNALLFAGRSVFGCTCYTWPLPPCAHCASLLIQSGIRRVVSVQPTPALAYRWGASFRLSVDLMTEAGLIVDQFDPAAVEDDLAVKALGLATHKDSLSVPLQEAV